MPTPQIFRRTTETELAFVAGLIVGEGSFTGDGRQPHCAIGMAVRHEHLLRVVQSWYPLSRLYGPYPLPGNRQPKMVLMWRGPALVQLIRDLEDFGLEDYCPHVHGRMLRVKEQLEA